MRNLSKAAKYVSNVFLNVIFFARGEKEEVLDDMQYVFFREIHLGVFRKRLARSSSSPGEKEMGERSQIVGRGGIIEPCINPLGSKEQAAFSVAQYNDQLNAKGIILPRSCFLAGMASDF